ncbi:glutamate racemase [uncultured Ilyobacter sp.]|uniref:glutamate racemase n=1 Tax=uncultured Ilyobacter sp. TaxID=544433 RepID=UPI002AA95E04|nr:glutamate racemase [uncultured Ilyobacter sp.]
MDNRGIGVFDSGFGGLTVVKEIKKVLPGEKIYYFGDTARLPYGSKSKENIIHYSLEIAEFLKTKDIKALVVACNTASAFALDELKKHCSFPVIGVIEAGSRRALGMTKKGKVGIIGTKGTVSSGVYNRSLSKGRDGIEVYSKPCPLFVPLVEEGMIKDEVTEIMIDRYLGEFKNKVDSLIMGCTHYPLLEDEIKKYFEKYELEVVNPAVETALELEKLLADKNLVSKKSKGEIEFYVSDSPDHFKKLGEMFLGDKIDRVDKINIEDYWRG